MVKESMSSSSLSSRFFTMFQYSSSRMDSRWFIISASSIINPIFCKSPLNNSSSVVQSSGYLVMSYNSLFVNFLHSLVLEVSVVGSNVIYGFIHACLVSPYLFSFVFDCLIILKHIISYCANIISF